MEIEMVDTIMGRVPLVALDVERVVVAENDDQRTVQITYRADGAIVRQDGVVEVKRWPPCCWCWRSSTGTPRCCPT